jgi:hypothetical protein
MFEDGAVISMVGGSAVLPVGANMSAVTLDVGAAGHLIVEGGDRALSGTINGRLTVHGGTVVMADVVGNANIDVDANASVVFAGFIDSNVTVENRGHLTFAGNTSMHHGMRNLGLVTVSSGATLTFDGDVDTEIAGAGIENSGHINIDRGHITMSQPMRSAGNDSQIAITHGARLTFESANASQIGGTGMKLETGASLVFAGEGDVQ